MGKHRSPFVFGGAVGIRYAKRVASLQTQALRKKISDGVKRARAKETPEQRAAHNNAIAKSYRHTVGWRVYSEHKNTENDETSVAGWRMYESTKRAPGSRVATRGWLDHLRNFATW